MRIIFDESTLEQSRSASRSITGVLYFDFGGFAFPDERWNDFAVVITSWWLEALEKLDRGIEQEVLLRFMDGPYGIALSRQDGDVVLLRCTEERRNVGVVHEEYASLSEVSAQVRQLARQLAVACGLAGIESSDVDLLRRHLPN
jgi:hypothetical protein